MIDIKQITRNKTSLESWLKLCLTNKIGSRTIFKLLEYFGTVDSILSQNLNTLERFINPAIAKLIYEKTSNQVVEASLLWLENKHSGTKRHIISIEDAKYPKELLEISDPPLILYLEGNISLLENKKFAIVGTRHPTAQGIENARSFGQNLSNNGLTVVSGVASGIDRYAHIGALDGKSSTIGVIGAGIDIVYPKNNNDVYNKILENGLLISEFGIGTAPVPKNFPRRNRVIAGLSLGLLVVESAIDGGSMISANLALDMGREVMAIPGSIFNPVAKGCHKLIKSGAKLVENINDILEEININPRKLCNYTNNNDVSQDDPVLREMGFEPISIDAICEKVQLSFSDLCAKLLEFELTGSITNCGGGYYQRIFK
ncbi:MAG: DNA-processing protein DprA [Neisseriaceae bacterium]